MPVVRGARRLQGFAEKVLGKSEPEEAAFVAQGLLWFVRRVSIPRNWFVVWEETHPEWDCLVATALSW